MYGKWKGEYACSSLGLKGCTSSQESKIYAHVEFRVVGD